MMAVQGISVVSGAPQLEGESGSCRSAGKRSLVSFQGITVFFTEEEWALVGPGQRKLFWEVMEENHKTITSLGIYVSRKALQGPERSILPIADVQAPVFPQGGEGKIWNVEFHRASLLSCFPPLEREFGSGTSARKVSLGFPQQLLGKSGGNYM
uniref:Uncharacterized protein n=1 Tax=Sphaerodactylus townsendi TaxID=933632 RepID=A0ACB8EF53_9SAUR